MFHEEVFFHKNDYEVDKLVLFVFFLTEICLLATKDAALIIQPGNAQVYQKVKVKYFVDFGAIFQQQYFVFFLQVQKDYWVYFWIPLILNVPKYDLGCYSKYPFLPIHLSGNVSFKYLLTYLISWGFSGFGNKLVNAGIMLFRSKLSQLLNFYIKNGSTTCSSMIPAQTFNFSGCWVWTSSIQWEFSSDQ